MKFLFEFMPFILLNLKHKGGLVGPGIPGGFRFFWGGGGDRVHEGGHC